MSEAHHTRAHATWSASSTARNWACPGALTLAARVDTQDRESEAAAWGTACHTIAEAALRSDLPVAEALGAVIQTKEHAITVDEEMVETAQMYVDYVGEASIYGVYGQLWIEQQFSLAALNPPFDAGGTCDAIIHTPNTKSLEVVDLKGGRGVVVEVVGNPQLRTYALGAMLANPGLKVDQVTVTIVQPRAPHKDGRIRSETFHVADLLEWTSELLEAMEQADLARASYGYTTTAIWNQAWLNAGDHCKFCPAAGICPALEQRAMDAAGVWYDDSDQPRISNSPDSMDPAELAKKLDTFDLIQEWVNAVRSYAHEQAERGVEIPGYQLAEKIGNRAWKNDELDIALTIESHVPGIARDAIYQPAKLKTPAQMEKVLGPKRKHLIEDLVERPVRGTNLVKSTKTTRPAAKPAAERTAALFYEAT